MIRIITDSAADFEPWELEKMNVTCIPLAVTFGNREYRENLIGTVQEVLFEEANGDHFTGHAPNYVKVYAEGKELHNLVKNVVICDVMNDGVFGKISE